MKKIWLPKTDSGRADALYRFLQEAEKIRNISAVDWYVVKHYLQGCRYFESIEYSTGKVKPSYEDENGGVPYRYEEIVQKASTEVGRLMRLDTNPAVPRQLPGLDGLQKESTAQAILDSILPHTDYEATRLEFFKMLVELGCAGLYTYELAKDDADKDKPEANIVSEVVPPWEILFLPANVSSAHEAQCIVRDRWIPLEEVKEIKIGGQSLSIPSGADGREKMEVLDVPFGASVSSQPMKSSTASTSISGPSGFSTGKKSKDTVQQFVRVFEIFTKYHNGRLSSYEVLIGKHMAFRKEYKNKSGTPMCNLSVASSGTGLYGRGFASILIHTNAEVEAALQNLFKNGQDFDMYGLLGIPVSLGVDSNELDALAPGGRRYFWMDRDPSRPNEQVEHIQPVTSGTLPAEIANVGFAVMDRLSQQPELITQGSAPGRVDSRVGMDYLYQASTVPLGRLASSISSAYAQMYKAWLGFAQSWKNVKINMTAMADDSIIGIKLNNELDMLELEKNVVPDPASLAIGIRSQKPINKEQQKMVLDTWLQQGIISPQQYRIHYRLQKLEPELPRDSEWENYRMAIVRNIRLFNDGREPGDLSSDSLGPSEYDNPEIQLMVIRRLMASPEFALSSSKVQNKFSELVEAFENAAGQFPEAMPMPEDIAEEQQMMMNQEPELPIDGALPDKLAAAMGGSGADLNSLLGE